METEILRVGVTVVQIPKWVAPVKLRGEFGAWVEKNADPCAGNIVGRNCDRSDVLSLPVIEEGRELQNGSVLLVVKKWNSKLH